MAANRHIRNQHAFTLEESLHIDIQRRSQRGMPQKFSHDLEFRPNTSEKGRMSVTEGVPADSSLNAGVSDTACAVSPGCTVKEIPNSIMVA